MQSSGGVQHLLFAPAPACCIMLTGLIMPSLPVAAVQELLACVICFCCLQWQGVFTCQGNIFPMSSSNISNTNTGGTTDGFHLALHLPAFVVYSLRSTTSIASALFCWLPAAALPGLVFVPLSQPYLHEYGDDWMSNSPRRLVDKALNSLMAKPGQQIIVLSQVLVDDINTGYQQFQNLQVCIPP
jgi:hypothetical protein